METGTDGIQLDKGEGGGGNREYVGRVGTKEVESEWGMGNEESYVPYAGMQNIQKK